MVTPAVVFIIRNLTPKIMVLTTTMKNSKPTPSARAEPETDCQLCPRLVAFRRENQHEHPDWFNGAVPSFGQDDAQLLIVGLAPGLRGANRTGRPFTGDYAGDLLYSTLIEFGYASGSYQAASNDGLELKNCMITNAVRCLPPQNKPIGVEINNCSNFLISRIASLPNLRAVVALGKIAHDSVVRSYRQKLTLHKFRHGAIHLLSPVTLHDSYHCSRYNTNTRRLTEDMFRDVFRGVSQALGNDLAPR